MGLLLAVFLSFVPAVAYALFVRWLDRYEREPLGLVAAVFAWGAIVAVIGALVGQVILGKAVLVASGSTAFSNIVGATVLAPLTEESLKGLAVLLVFVFFRREFDSLLDGIVYASVTALGFAATENVLYLYGEGFSKNGFEGLAQLFVLRVVLGGWDHPFYTAMIGIGLTQARLTRSGAWAFLAPVLGWSLAVFFHSLHNGLASLAGMSGCFGLLMFFIDWSGWVAMAVLILVALSHERRLLVRHLADEMSAGIITTAQYHTALSTWAQSFARLQALTEGRWRVTRQFYQVCGTLAHKKHQRARLGEESGNSALIASLREELARLAPYVKS